MILCKRKRDSKRRTVQSTYIENSPSIRMGANSRKFTSFVLAAVFTHLETSSNCSRQAKDDARRISDYKRPVAMLFEKTVSNPHRAVDECDERLNPVSLMTGQISKVLWNIGNVHTDGQTGGNHANNFHLVFSALSPICTAFSSRCSASASAFFNTSSISCSPTSKQINDPSTLNIVPHNFLTHTTFPNVYRWNTDIFRTILPRRYVRGAPSKE